ncbi:hypothetical protein [Rossellomorea marisflavi]|uniref:hypothetical protein n=1 Tax=Rossellomorea marisflavi TaxID=189381 RepID=UPI001EE1AB7E|nr:hypothetical protein [Rossellomorea marisflavi]UKS64699.1 hypothetical protein K6T23_18270 [Rossellomorea marisflavi]
MSDELKNKLMEDILKTGFPLEMEITQTLRENDWAVRNGSYYIDKDEDKGREIDIIATKHIVNEIEETGFSREVVFSLIIEIKKTEGKPWVFFTSEAEGSIEKILPIDVAIAGFKTQSYLLMRMFRENSHQIHTRIGRNFYVGFSGNGGRDDIYKALSSVIKATRHSLENSVAAGNKGGDELFYYYEPVVVIKGNLFEVYIDDEGKQVLEEADYIQTQFNYISSNYPIKSRKIVHVIKADYLPQFINEHKDSLHSFCNSLS